VVRKEFVWEFLGAPVAFVVALFGIGERGAPSVGSVPPGIAKYRIFNESYYVTRLPGRQEELFLIERKTGKVYARCIYDWC